MEAASYFPSVPRRRLVRWGLRSALARAPPSCQRSGIVPWRPRLWTTLWTTCGQPRSGACGVRAVGIVVAQRLDPVEVAVRVLHLGFRAVPVAAAEADAPAWLRPGLRRRAGG